MDKVFELEMDIQALKLKKASAQSKEQREALEIRIEELILVMLREMDSRVMAEISA